MPVKAVYSVALHPCLVPDLRYQEMRANCHPYPGQPCRFSHERLSAGFVPLTTAQRPESNPLQLPFMFLI